MNKFLSISLKLIGLYFCYLSIELITPITHEFYKNELYNRSYFQNTLILSLFLKFIFFLLVSWFLIFRTELIKNKLFNINKLDNKNTEIKHLTINEISFQSIKLIGLFLLLKNAIVLIYVFISLLLISEVEKDLKNTTLILILIQSSFPFIKFIGGILMFIFAEKLLKLITD